MKGRDGKRKSLEQLSRPKCYLNVSKTSGYLDLVEEGMRIEPSAELNWQTELGVGGWADGQVLAFSINSNLVCLPRCSNRNRFCALPYVFITVTVVSSTE